jgi:hypothetical protein
MSPSQHRLIVLANLALCTVGLSACQTTGAPENNAALGVAQNLPRAVALGATPHQAQIKSLSASPKQAVRPDQPIAIGVAF